MLSKLLLSGADRGLVLVRAPIDGYLFTSRSVGVGYYTSRLFHARRTSQALPTTLIWGRSAFMTTNDIYPW